MKYKIVLLFTFLISLIQTVSASNENQDFMRNIGKIYVVVAVIIATFIGLAIFMIYIDRKITRLEKELQ
ncbi:MAG: CcmD family protein [Saprospiraceae bacterium]